jgi:hypothetical protein
MRLTLRTLLAYLDDILEPSQTKEIGVKLQESKFASDLVDRIREVMRRRRLSSPAIDGKDGSLDANLMAEYLDNTLSPEKVTEIEKRCLESDMHLAEAAACHQILTLVLGEPVEIAAESRRRMYGLLAQPVEDELTGSGAMRLPDASAVERADAMSVPVPTLESGEPGSKLPEYLQPRPLRWRVFAIAAFVAVPLVFLVLVATDPANNFFRGLGNKTRNGSAPPNETAPNQAVAPHDAGGNPATGPVGEGEVVKKGSSAETAKAGSGAPSAGHGEAGTNNKETITAALTPATSLPAPNAESSHKPESQPTGAAITAIAPLPMPAAGETAKPGATGQPPVGSPLAVVASRPGAAEKPAAQESGAKTITQESPPPGTVASGPTSESAAVNEPAPEVRLEPNTGILLGYDSDRGEWFAVSAPLLTLPQGNPTSEPAKGGVKVAPPKSKVAPPLPMGAEKRADQLASPDPFESTLDIGKGKCRVTILGGTSVQLLGPNRIASFGFELRQGRLVMRSSSAKGSFEPLKVAIAVRDEIWKLEFLRPDTRCGIEIFPAFPTRPGETVKEVGYRGRLLVASGELKFIEPAGRQRTLAAGRGISLTPQDRAVAMDTLADEGMPFKEESWLSPEKRRLPAVLTKLAHDYQKEFLPGQPISLSISTTSKDDRPKIAELAAETLALVGLYQPLVEVLAEVPHEEAVHQAAYGLRAWLPLAPDHATLLRRELASTFVPEEQEIVLRLLWGYNRDDARNRGTSEQLVEWLDNPKLAIRVLAYDQIHELTGQTLRYRPAMPVAQRKNYKHEWENYVKRNNGLIKP